MSIESEVVGEGSFGCVIKPSLPCSDKNISYKNKISKVMLSKEAVKELKEYAIISKIDKQNDFYLGNPTLCHVKNTKGSIKAIDKCNQLKKKYLQKKTVKDNINKFDLLVMNDGGINLKMLSSMIENMPYTAENTKKVKQIWIEMHRLFHGLSIFQKHDILHHDIKPQNIVFNMDENRVNFIDFGHMRNIKAEKQKCLESDNWIYDYPFWNYPLEIQFLNKKDYSNFAYKSNNEKNRFFTTLLDDLHKDSETKFVDAFRIFIDYIVHKKSDSEEKNIINKYLFAYQKMIIDQIKPDKYNDFLNKSLKTIDVYGLGMSLYYLLNCSRKFLEKAVIDSMEDCFFNMTTSDVGKRFIIEQSIDIFESILIESGFMEEFGIVFEKHEIIENKNKKEKENSSIYKKINRVKGSDLSVSKMDNNRLLNALELPECPNGLVMNVKTKKCTTKNSRNRSRSHNRTKTLRQ